MRQAKSSFFLRVTFVSSCGDRVHRNGKHAWTEALDGGSEPPFAWEESVTSKSVFVSPRNARRGSSCLLENFAQRPLRRLSPIASDGENRRRGLLVVKELILESLCSDSNLQPQDAGIAGN